jgi:hypothetical protein
MWNHIKKFDSILIIVLTLPMPAQTQGKSDEERDFVPGEKAIFYAHHTNMTKGAGPLHWKVRSGAAKLSPLGRLTLVDRLALYPNIKALPKNLDLSKRRAESVKSALTNLCFLLCFRSRISACLILIVE